MHATFNCYGRQWRHATTSKKIHDVMKIVAKRLFETSLCVDIFNVWRDGPLATTFGALVQGTNLQKE